MRFVARSDHTTVIRGEREEKGATVREGVGHLPAKVHIEDGHPYVTSHWKPDEEDLALLNAGGHIQLDLRTHQIPPVRVSAVEALPEIDPEEVGS